MSTQEEPPSFEGRSPIPDPHNGTEKCVSWTLAAFGISWSRFGMGSLHLSWSWRIWHLISYNLSYATWCLFYFWTTSRSVDTTYNFQHIGPALLSATLQSSLQFSWSHRIYQKRPTISQILGHLQQDGFVRSDRIQPDQIFCTSIWAITGPG